MPAWDQSQAAIFNLGPDVSTQSHVFTQSHVLRNPCLGPVPSSHFQLGTSPMLSIIPTWDRSHVGILTSNYNLSTSLSSTSAACLHVNTELDGLYQGGTTVLSLPSDITSCHWFNTNIFQHLASHVGTVTPSPTIQALYVLHCARDGAQTELNLLTALIMELIDGCRLTETPWLKSLSVLSRYFK